MKSRDEFLQSVYTKEKAAKAQRKKYKKRMITSLTAAAACLVLVVGMGRIIGADLMGVGMEGADSAAPEDAIGFYAGSEPGSDSAPSEHRSDSAPCEDGSGSSGGQNEPDSAGSSEKTSPEGALQGNIASDDHAPGDGSGDSAAGDTMVEAAKPDNLSVSGYYCMPVAVVVEDADGKGIRYEGFSEMDQAIKWVRKLAGDGKAFGEEVLSAEKKQDYVYKVTLVYSSEDDPDSAGSDQIYYILEEVAYFE